MYIQDVNGFTGDGKFLSKFGLEIRDEVTFQVAMRSYHAEVGSSIQQSRPREGDMIYFPLNDKCLQIKYVDQTPVFYQLGALQMYSLVCELFEYSNETFNTGLPFIDSRYNVEETDELDYQFLLEDGDAFLFEDGSYWVLDNTESEFDLIDPGSQNDEIQEEADKYINWGESNPFSEKY